MSDYVIQQIVNALSAGSLYALMAVGLAMVFGILRLINFAHGDLMMIAAYLAVFCIGAGLPLEAAVPIMIAGTVIVGLLMERIAYRPIRGAPDVAMLLTSFAVGQILQNGTLLTTRLAGEPTLIAFPSPEQLNGVIAFGTITIPKVNVVSFVTGIILAAKYHALATDFPGLNPSAPDATIAPMPVSQLVPRTANGMNPAVASPAATTRISSF